MWQCGLAWLLKKRGSKMSGIVLAKSLHIHHVDQARTTIGARDGPRCPSGNGTFRARPRETSSKAISSQFLFCYWQRWKWVTLISPPFQLGRKTVLMLTTHSHVSPADICIPTREAHVTGIKLWPWGVIQGQMRERTKCMVPLGDSRWKLRTIISWINVFAAVIS